MGERLKEKSKTRLDKEKWRINHVILLLCIKLDNYAAKKKKKNWLGQNWHKVPLYIKCLPTSTHLWHSEIVQKIRK